MNELSTDPKCMKLSCVDVPFVRNATNVRLEAFAQLLHSFCTAFAQTGEPPVSSIIVQCI